MTPNDFKDQLEKKLAAFDKEGVAKLCTQLIVYLYQTDQPFDKAVAGKILQLLRNKRMFGWMQKVCDALIFTKRDSLKINRQYAQSLIDSGIYSAALSVLNTLSIDSKNTTPQSTDAIKEGIEAKGLIGRLYKQLYINAAKLDSHNSHFLMQALNSYYEVYKSGKEDFLWHGINAVALLYRAEKDGIQVPGFPDYGVLAKEILTGVEEKENEKRAETPYDYAIAAEACIALNRPKQAAKWTAYYSSDQGSDAFELAGTLRQFEEVWNLEADSESGKLVLPILRTELLKREGGQITIDASEIRNNREEAVEENKSYEKNFGNNVFIDFKSYKKGYSCCESVARIGRFTQKGDGTGFLLMASEFDERLQDEYVLVTNAHVVSEDSVVRMNLGALHPDEAIIIFEALDRNEEFKIGSILFYSSPIDLDVTVIRFAPDELKRVKKLVKNVTPYKVSKVLPVTNVNPLANPRLYVIGHPKGGPLQFSMQDNLLLDYQEPLIHYRTPTEGGSSGSPVFNQQWELIGLHHAGKKDMKKLNGKEGVYEANEGIWIHSIINKFKKSLH
ncbi:MAG: serine protease [Chitinophagaceae bacterium]